MGYSGIGALLPAMAVKRPRATSRRGRALGSASAVIQNPEQGVAACGPFYCLGNASRFGPVTAAPTYATNGLQGRIQKLRNLFATALARALFNGTNVATRGFVSSKGHGACLVLAFD